MLTRPQVKRWFFESVSEPVVTRFIDRVTSQGLLGVERLHGNGCQVLWLTRKGRDYLIDHGSAAADLFAATGPAAAKDFEHTIRIADAAIWVVKRNLPPDELLPAWTLQRFFGGRLAVIPDLLALWRQKDGRPGAALALEVDLGTEALASVLVPKIRKLEHVLNATMGTTFRILIIVSSMRRRESVRRALANLADVAVEALTPGVKSS